MKTTVFIIVCAKRKLKHINVSATFIIGFNMYLIKVYYTSSTILRQVKFIYYYFFNKYCYKLKIILPFLKIL